MHFASPIAGLRAAYERIALERAASLSENDADGTRFNRQLHVEIVGFKPWEAGYVGVLITPWAIKLALVSDDPARLKLTADQRCTCRFPSGAYVMTGSDEPECGAFQFSPLFSSAQEFADQAAAESIAMNFMRGLLVAPEFGAQADGLSALHAESKSLLEAPVSRRGFLRGVFGGSRDRNPS